MRKACYVLFTLCLLAACSQEHDHKGRTPLVELQGNFLYMEDLEAVLPRGLSADDSLLFAEHYIRNWVEDVLLYDKAQRNIPDNTAIDRLVESYRKSLIMHTYQQALIQQQLANELTEEELEGYYNQNKELFKVERPWIKGLFIKVPLGASGLNNVRRWYKARTPEAVEQLEKYSLRGAVQYEYFYDRWMPASEFVDKLPASAEALRGPMEGRKPLELRDTAFCYFLDVTDCLRMGEQEPFELARVQAREMLLNLRQVQFMERVKDDLYQRAVDGNKITYYTE